MKYRIEIGNDGFLIYLPVSDDTHGANVYNVDINSNGNLAYIKDDANEVQSDCSETKSIKNES